MLLLTTCSHISAAPNCMLAVICGDSLCQSCSAAAVIDNMGPKKNWALLGVLLGPGNEELTYCLSNSFQVMPCLTVSAHTKKWHRTNSICEMSQCRVVLACSQCCILQTYNLAVALVFGTPLSIRLEWALLSVA